MLKDTFFASVKNAKTIEELATLANPFARKSVENAYALGIIAIAAKDTVKHGGWQEWAAQTFGVSTRQVTNYMTLATIPADKIGEFNTIQSALDSLKPATTDKVNTTEAKTDDKPPSNEATAATITDETPEEIAENPPAKPTRIKFAEMATYAADGATLCRIKVGDKFLTKRRGTYLVVIE